MKHRDLKKRSSTLLLVVAMVITALPQLGMAVHAADLLDSTQFATVEELKKFNTDDRPVAEGGDGITNPAKVYFGKDNQQWWIAGSQNADSLTLFAASPLAMDQDFETNRGEKDYAPNSNWKCTYPKGAMVDKVYANHYGTSPLRKTLRELETSHFTDKEIGLLKSTKIFTEDARNNSEYSTEDTLYLAYGGAVWDEYITVGANTTDNLNGGLCVDKKYWGGSENFWLRAPIMPYGGNSALAISPGDYVISIVVDYALALVPAFELDLSSAIFASAVPEATSEGELALQDTDGDGAFTLRYTPETKLGTATVSQTKQSIAVTDITNDNTYLVAQNKDGAWAKKVSDHDVVFANEMDGTLADFSNCKVWLETTPEPTAENITYAAEVTQRSNGHNMKVEVGQNMSVTSGNTVQSNITGEITKITVTANDGYYFPVDYSVADSNGIQVKRDSFTQLTISGTPTADVSITLPAATEKADRTDMPNVTGGIGSTINGTDTTMEYAASEDADSWIDCTDKSTQTGAGTWYVRYKETDTQKPSPAAEVEVIAPTYTISIDKGTLTFNTQNEGYGSVSEQSVEIKNTGNSKVTLETPTSSNYGVTLSSNEIEPNGTTTVKIAPKKDLKAGEYKETIEIKTTQKTSVDIDVSFKVNGAFDVSLSASASEMMKKMVHFREMQ